MRGKLTLNLDDLSVDSFDTTRVETEKGTVHGAQCTCYSECTCPGCPTCDATCDATCPNTCAYTCDDASCAGTCDGCASGDPSCNGTCYFTCYKVRTACMGEF